MEEIFSSWKNLFQFDKNPVMKIKSIYIVLITASVFFASAVVYFIFSDFLVNDKLKYETESHIGKEFNQEMFQPLSKEDLLPVKTDKMWVIYILSSCEACHKEVEIANELNKNYSGIKILGLMGESEEVSKKYVAENNINFPVLLDKDGTFLKNRSLKYFPTNFIVENGVIKKALLGFPNNRETLLEFVR